jgi:hypothetical protein
MTTPATPLPHPGLPARPTPWHREPWPWLLALGPVAVIIAGIFTTLLAFRGADGLIADDYYKQGLAINRVLERERRAAELQVHASLAYAPESGRMRVLLRSAGPLPPALRLRLAHPTRSGMDHVSVLRQSAPGLYEGTIDGMAGGQTPAGRWHMVLEGGDWRLAGDWNGGAAAELGGETSAGIGANK